MIHLYHSMNLGAAGDLELRRESLGAVGFRAIGILIAISLSNGRAAIPVRTRY